MANSVINYALEQSVVAYLSSSLNNPSSSLSGSSVIFYTGISNVDKITPPPSITVMVNDCREVAYQTQIYEAMVDVRVAEMAADTVVLGNLALNTFNEFYTQCGINSASKWNNDTYNFKAIQVQTIDTRHQVDGDALINTGTFRFVCGLQ